MGKNKECPCCQGTNTGPTSVEYLDSMCDYFCYDCNKDFQPTKK